MSVERDLLWMDEWLSWFLLSDPSLEHMLRANADVINLSPPAYFLLGSGWVRLFGDSVLSLRLFTALGFSVGLIAVWWGLRSAYGRWPASVATLIAVCSCGALQRHNVEVRFYGLYFAAIAAGVAVAVLLARQPRPRRTLLVVNALVHALLCLTNYFGFVFSGALLVAQVAASLSDGGDVSERRRRALRVAASIFAGWLAFVPWLPAFSAHLSQSGGVYWTPAPYLPQLFAMYGLQQYMGFTVVVFAAAALFTSLGSSQEPSPSATESDDPATRRARRVLHLIALAFALVPAGTWILSQRGTSLFLSRYLFPSSIAFAVVWAEGVRALLARSAASTGLVRLAPRALFAAAALAHVVLPLAVYRNRPDVADRIDRLEAPPDVPIVVEHAHDYIQLVGYSDFADSYLFLIDMPFVLSEESARSGFSNTHILAALARHYDRVRVAEAETFLGRTDRFLVLTSPRHNWFERRILGNPRFEVEPYGDTSDHYLVLRRSDG